MTFEKITFLQKEDSEHFVTGAARFSRSKNVNNAALWDSVTLDYADQFSDGVSNPTNYNTFAYPTTITDPDGFQSMSEYRFDFGAPVKAAGPPPAGQSNGAIARRVYDSIGRLERVKTEFNGNPDYSYTRWTYPATGNMVNQYSTITDGAGEAYSFTKTDGLGRALFAVTEHPGSAGGYSTVRTAYDNLGRPVEVSVPTETNAATIPAGDDAAGYLYKTQTYDWKGRPLVSINTDGTITEASYGGCGCAGGETVTLLGESVPIPNTNPVQYGRRTQKAYSDSLGRNLKTEILHWDGTIYTTAVNEYNTRDQVRFVKQYQGAAPAGNTFQQQEIQYDGHGRQKQVHLPQFDPNAWTVYEYNQNDTLHIVTDPRNAKTTYTYNNRKMLTQKHYSNFTPAPADENFAYDAAGNRTSMQDGTGTLTYAYDQLSRLTSETRIFNGLSNSYVFNYGYNRSGQLASVSDPFGGVISYNHDATGRMSGITGTGFGGVTNFMSGLQYRAWGAKKHLTTGNGVELNLGYNARLAATGYTVSNLSDNTTPNVNYNYFTDGQLKFAGSGTAAQPNFFDRAYIYDQAGRMKDALSGHEAHGLTTINGPYKQNYGFDVWGNTTMLTSRMYSQTSAQSFPHTNGRRNDWNGCYDAAGHVVREGWGAPAPLHTLDAAERHVNFESNDVYEHFWFNSSLEIAHTFDGNGAPAKQSTTHRIVDYDSNGLPFAASFTTTAYYLRASALGGQVVAELNGQGQLESRAIYAGGFLVAKVVGAVAYWNFTDPATGTTYQLNSPFTWPTPIERTFIANKELDPLGRDVTHDPGPQQYPSPIYLDPYQSGFWGPKVTQSWPVEYAAHWTGELESGMAEYEGRLQNTRDTIAAREAWKKGDRQTWEAILASNPNVGLEVRGGGYRFNLYGADAGDFLGRLSTALTAGLLVAGDAATRAALGGIYAHAQKETEEQRKQRIASLVAKGEVTDEDEKYADRMVEIAYDKCNPNSQHMPRGLVRGVLAATSSNTTIAAQIMSIMRREARPGQLLERPAGDAGPAQLTKYWSRNYPQLVVGNAYGSWNGRSDRSFDGNVLDNLRTMRNIVFFNTVLHGSFQKAAYWYGPGTKASPRQEYADGVMNNYNNLYKPFFDCIARELAK